MYKNHKISLVVPAYNEQKLIKPTISHVPKCIDKIIVIDDGSKDNTVKVIKSVKDKRIKLIKHEKNKGLGAALVTGYKESIKQNVDIAVVVGGDNQMDLKEVEKFLDPIVKGEVDYTKGNRFLNDSFKLMPFPRLLGNILLSSVEKFATGYWNLFDMHDGYTAINKKALKAVNWDEAWTKYAYNVDFLARLNVAKMKVKDVSRRAIYLKGERQSQIKTLRYMIMAIPLIVNCLVWRVQNKYLKFLH